MPFKKKHVLLLVIAEIVALLCILVPSIFEIYNNNSIRATAELRLFQEAGDNVKYYDEVLTMSARMCILRGDEGWRSRYNSFVGPITVLLGAPGKIGRVEEIENTLLDEFNTGHDDSDIGRISTRYQALANDANDALIIKEEAALAVCRLKGSIDTGSKAAYTAGKNGLFDTDYRTNKNTLTEAINFLESKISQLVDYQEDEDDSRKSLNTAIIVIIAVVLALIMGSLGWYTYKLMTLEKKYLEAYRNVLKYEQRDWLTNDALLTLRTNIISDVRRGTLRRYQEADADKKEHMEVLQKPKDLQIADVPVTASTMRFMEMSG